MKLIATLIIPLIAGVQLCFAQQSITLEECQRLARENYPVISQYGIIEKLEDFNVSNARRNWLPRVSVSAMASYLSEVPAFPQTLNDLFAQLGMSFGAMPHTQYGAAVQVQQVIWDGGRIKTQVEAAKAESDVARRSWEAEMYSVGERVNQIFFGSLLLQENLISADLLIADLERNYKMLESTVEYGTAEKNELDMLRVEILRAQQQRAGLESSRRAYMAMLGIMIGRDMDETARLVKPVPPAVPAGDAVTRPELAVLDARAGLLDVQRKALRAGVMPQIGAFVLGAYSNPGPDIFQSMTGDRKWSPFLFAGISLKWNIDGFYTKRNKMAQIELDARRLDSQRKTFLYNMSLQSTQQKAAIDKMAEEMRYDDEIIHLRTAIRKRTEARVAGGDGSVNDLLRDINAEETARQNRNAHEAEWLKNIYDLKYTLNR